MTYRAVHEREADGRWTVEILKVKRRHADGRTFAQAARDRIHEGLQRIAGHAGTVEVEADVCLPAESDAPN